MKKALLTKLMLLLCAIIVGGANSKALADEAPVYTLSFTQLTSEVTNYNSYTAAHNYTSGGIGWSVYGNQSMGDYLRVGGSNKTATDRTLTSSAVLSSTKSIKKVKINHAGIVNGKDSEITVNSITVEGSTVSDFSSSVISQTVSSPSVTDAGTIEIVSPEEWVANSYFRITVNYQITGNNNCYLTINSIDFYEHGVFVAAPTIDLSNQFMIDKGTTTTITQAAATSIKYTTDGSDPTSSGTATIGVSGVSVPINETTTIKAVAYDAEDNASMVISKNYIVKPDLDLTNGVFTVIDFSAVSGTYGEYDFTFSGCAGWHGVQLNKYSGHLQFKANGGVLTSPTIITANGFTIRVTYENNNIGTMTSSADDASTGDGTVSTLTTTSTSTRITINAHKSNAARITQIEIIPTKMKATITSSGYSSFASPAPLDCADLPDGLTAYKIASDPTSTTVTLTPVTEAVAAGTGLILAGTGGETYNIPVAASGTDISASNKLVGVTEDTEVPWTVDGKYNYILQSGAFYMATGKKLRPGKSYLRTTYDVTAVGASSLKLEIEDDMTGINDVRSKTADVRGEYFNLAGQRVAQPTKGLYIVNGKKIVVK